MEDSISHIDGEKGNEPHQPLTGLRDNPHIQRQTRLTWIRRIMLLITTDPDSNARGVAVHAGAGAGVPIAEQDDVSLLLAALLDRVKLRRDIWVRLSFGVLGFMPIVCLALAMFEIVPLHLSGPGVALPAAFAAIALGVRFPRYGRLAARGYLMALVAVWMYDVTRALSILTGQWNDFIPNIGAQLLHRHEGHAPLGYAWRWLGNGGGMGVAFFMVYPVFARGREVVQAAVKYGVFVWTCLIITVLAAPHGEELLFRLTPKTFVLSLIGHLVFGAVLGYLMRWTGLNVRPYPADRASRSSQG
jgi:hypothetical protein